MFAYIKGTLEYKHNEYVVIDVNGIGFKVYTSLSTINEIGAIGERVKVYTYYHVREDAVNLFGFLTKEELGVFELLISVSGVGPKAAISVLSSISPSKFGLAVITNDVKTLTKVPGIGTKTAQRIILELKDKIKNEDLTGFTEQESGEESYTGDSSLKSEAISALVVLGYSPFEASQAVAAVYNDDMDVEAIIKAALKAITKA